MTAQKIKNEPSLHDLLEKINALYKEFQNSTDETFDGTLTRYMDVEREFVSMPARTQEDIALKASYAKRYCSEDDLKPGKNFYSSEAAFCLAHIIRDIGLLSALPKIKTPYDNRKAGAKKTIKKRAEG